MAERVCDPSDELVDLIDDAQAVLDVTSECDVECAAQVRIRVNTNASCQSWWTKII